MKFSVIKEKIAQQKTFIPAACGALAPVLMSSVSTFAAGEASGGNAALDSVVVSSDMLQPVLDAITSNIAVILPVGVVLFGVMLGIALIPKILSKFTSPGK